MLRAVSSVAVAMMSSVEHPAADRTAAIDQLARRTPAEKFAPGRLRRRRVEERRLGAARRRRRAIGVPRRASAPPTSYGRSGTSARTVASSTPTPGPVSNARTLSSTPPGGMSCTFAMPPRFSVARHSSGELKSIASAIVTSGAPCPPAATSRDAEVGNHRHARALGDHRGVSQSATSRAVRRARSCARATRSPRCPARATPASAITATAASPSHAPRSKSRRAYSCADSADEGGRDAIALRRRVRPCHERRAARTDRAVRFAEPHDGRRDAVEARAGHQPDEDGHAGSDRRGRSASRSRRIDAVLLLERGARVAGVDVQLLHHDRDLHAAVGGAEQCARGVRLRKRRTPRARCAPRDPAALRSTPAGPPSGCRTSCRAGSSRRW